MAMEQPKYRHIMEEIKARIASGEYKPGKPLPSERNLAKIYSTNHETANKAVSHLVAEGLVYRKRGIGTFVAEEQENEDTSNLLIDILLYRKASDLFRAASFHEEIVFALQKIILGRGYGSRITPVLDIDSFEEYVRQARAFITGKYLPFRHLQIIHDAGLPVVALNIDALLPGATMIKTENQAIDELCRHLVDLGHERIGLLRRPGHVPAHDLREYRFKNFMELVELPGNLDRVFYLTPEEDGQSSRLVSDIKKCTAVVATDDFLAIKLHQLLHRFRIAVPEEISITGFGNLSLTDTLFPSLTTADVDRESLCKAIVDEAFRMMDAPEEGRTILFPSFAVIRESTAPPR